MRYRKLALAILPFFALPLQVAEAAPEDDVRALLDGVKSIGGSGGLPGALITFGPNARAVVVGGTGPRRTVVACARIEKSRAVAWAHDGYFSAGQLNAADGGKLFENAVAWAAGRAIPRVGVVENDALAGWLEKKKHTVVRLAGKDWHRNLGKVDVLVARAPQLGEAPRLAAAKALLGRGGGLLMADTGCGWAQLNPGKSLTTDHPGNQLLAPAGLMWTGEFTHPDPKTGFDAGSPPPKDVEGGAAVDFILKSWPGVPGVKGQKAREQAQSTLTTALSVLPPDDALLLPRLREARKQAGDRLPLPTARSPVKPHADKGAALLVLDTLEAKHAPARSVKAHPAAATFPGAVPDRAKPVDRKVSVDTAVPDWHSTGLYAPPGKAVTVTLPARAADRGLRVRVGCHSDSLWSAREWRRMPEVSRSWPLAKEKTEVASAFGGLVYVEVPHGCKLGAVEVRVQGAVEAPRFVLGKTTRAEWLDKQLGLPGPWAELETSKIILTVPARAVRDLRDPEALMKKWDEVLDACADLASIPRKRTRPERFVVDEQISAGYMHSGYPIMAHLDVEKKLVDLAGIVGGEVEPVWGMFHELGHNHQASDWTFQGTVEVTVNLFTMYVFEKVVKRPDMGLHFHRLAKPEQRNKLVKEHLDAGAKFSEWDGKPFTALMMYVQLREAFGWEAFQKVFAEYRKLPPKERPRTEQEKRDQWMVRFSRQVNRDLGPFFQAWGVPTTAAARARVAKLPGWMPKDFPPR